MFGGCLFRPPGPNRCSGQRRSRLWTAATWRGSEKSRTYSDALLFLFLLPPSVPCSSHLLMPLSDSRYPLPLSSPSPFPLPISLCLSLPPRFLVKPLYGCTEALLGPHLDIPLSVRSMHWMRPTCRRNAKQELRLASHSTRLHRDRHVKRETGS